MFTKKEKGQNCRALNFKVWTGFCDTLLHLPYMKTISRIISLLFHPFLFPTYGALLILGLNPNIFDYYGDGFRRDVVWVGIVFVLTFVFPVIWILMMRGLEMINSLKMETSRERIIPYVASMTFYLWTAWTLKSNVHMKIEGNQFLFYMMVGASISMAVAFFMNAFSNISLRTVGAGGIVGLLLILVRFSTYDLRLVFVGAILMAGIIGSARLILKAHTEVEVFSGYLIGFVGQFLAFSVISKFF